MVGMLTGPALAGLLVGTYGVHLPLLLHAASMLALVAAGLLVRTRRGGARAPVPEPEPSQPIRWTLWRDPILRTMVVSLAIVVAAVAAMNVVDVFFARETLHASEAMYGLLEATWTAGMLAGTWLLARFAQRARDDGALVYGLLVVLGAMCATLAAAATVGAAAWLLPLWIAGGAGNGGLNVYANVLVARRTPEQSRGRTFATVGATVNGAAMAGYLAGGPLVELVPTRPLVAGIGFAGMIVVGLLVPAVVRPVRRERATTLPPTSYPARCEAT